MKMKIKLQLFDYESSTLWGPQSIFGFKNGLFRRKLKKVLLPNEKKPKIVQFKADHASDRSELPRKVIKRPNDYLSLSLRRATAHPDRSAHLVVTLKPEPIVEHISVVVLLSFLFLLPDGAFELLEGAHHLVGLWKGEGRTHTVSTH